MNPLQSSIEPAASFASRLRELISEHPSANAFAKRVHVTESLVRKYLAGGTPGLDKVVRIATAENVSVHWLATGEGPRRLQPEAALTALGTEQEHGGRMLVDGMEMRAVDPDMVSLPRLNIIASAGTGLVPVDEEISGFIAIKREYLRFIDVHPSFAHIATLRGHSMKPTLLDGDLIIVDTSKTEVINEMIYAVVYGDTVLAKRIQLLWDGSLRIISDNKADGYLDEIVPASERNTLRVVGRIKGYLRHF